MAPVLKDSTFNPWPGRIRRSLIVIVILLAWLSFGKFMTFQHAGSDGYDGEKARCSTVQNFSTLENALTAIGEKTGYVFERQYRWDGARTQINIGGKTYEITQAGSGYELKTYDDVSCSWTGTYNASWSDYVAGYLIAAVLTALSILVLVLLGLGLKQVGQFIWSGQTSRSSSRDRWPCDSPDCTCIEHKSPTFNHETKEWDYPDCEDDSCTCKDH